MSDTDDLKKLVNASGFAFQLGIENAVSQRRGHSWRVISREHPWSLGAAEGFIDLVLGGGIATGVVECKRTRGGVWVFLVPDGEETKRSGSRVLWVAGTKDGRSLAGIDGVEHLPATYTSPFCVVRGTGENDRPLLERLCSTLLMSVEALAAEEVGILQSKKLGWHGFYLPIIVTTADLHVCRMSPASVALSTGNIDAATFEAVPFLRFQKSFAGSAKASETAEDLQSSAAARERTVWVVGAQHIDEFLASIRNPPFKERYPWEAALKALEADSSA